MSCQDGIEYVCVISSHRKIQEQRKSLCIWKRKEWADDEEALDDIHDDRSSISEQASWNKSANNKLEHLIIGDSIIQNISNDKFHKSKKTKIITQRGKGIDNVKDYLQQTELDPKNLIMHTGSNDIANMDIDNVKEKFESLFDIMYLYPLIVMEIAPSIEMYLSWVHSSKRYVFNMEPPLCSTTMLIKMKLVSEAVTYTYQIKVLGYLWQT